MTIVQCNGYNSNKKLDFLLKKGYELQFNRVSHTSDQKVNKPTDEQCVLHIYAPTFLLTSYIKYFIIHFIRINSSNTKSHIWPCVKANKIKKLRQETIKWCRQEHHLWGWVSGHSKMREWKGERECLLVPGQSKIETFRWERVLSIKDVLPVCVCVRTATR